MSLDKDMMGQDQASPLASKAQIAMAIIVRQAMNDGDTAKTAEQLAEILEPLGIDLNDIRQGLPWHKLSDGDPS